MRASIITIVCVSTLISAVLAAHRYEERTRVQPRRDLIRMISVRTIIASALDAVFAQQGRYPQSLSQLAVQTLRWGEDGASPRDLVDWDYRSDGQSYTMTWTSTCGMRLFLTGRGGDHSYTFAHSVAEERGVTRKGM